MNTTNRVSNEFQAVNTVVIRIRAISRGALSGEAYYNIGEFRLKGSSGRYK